MKEIVELRPEAVDDQTYTKAVEDRLLLQYNLEWRQQSCELVHNYITKHSMASYKDSEGEKKKARVYPAG